MSGRRLDLSLCLVTDPGLAGGRGLLATVEAAVAGGVTLVQLRDKHSPDGILLEQARALMALLAPLGVPLLVNDRVDVAAAAGADGAHVGQDDLDAASARARLGPQAVIGLSVTSIAEAERVPAGLVDYVGVGPVFDTATKPDRAPPLGLDGLAACHAVIPVPCLAIGGIGAGNAAEVMRHGADGVAVVSAICGTADPRAAARAVAAAVAAGRSARGAAA